MDDAINLFDFLGQFLGEDNAALLQAIPPPTGALESVSNPALECFKKFQAKVSSYRTEKNNRGTHRVSVFTDYTAHADKYENKNKWQCRDPAERAKARMSPDLPSTVGVQSLADGSTSQEEVAHHQRLDERGDVAAISSLRENELQGAIAQASTWGEVTAIGGDDYRFGRQFGEGDKRCIGGIHLQVFEHEPLCAGKMLGPRSREDERAFSHRIEQRVSGLRVATEVPARFAEHDLRGVQRAAPSGESLHAPLVPLVVPVEPADERPGVNDRSYFHSLRGSKDRPSP